MASNLRLVDDEGQPLAKHIVEAVQQCGPGIHGHFSRLCDPADLSNCLEDGARRIAQYEEDHGPLLDVGAFTWRTLFNAAISLVRKYSHEKCVEPERATYLRGAAREGSPRDILAGIAAREILAEMSDRDRQICYFEHQGFKASEIAHHLDMTANSVSKAKSRRLAKFAAKMTSK
jgi:DNA-directed RNA polymerase specialized sigma24 family protein